MDQSYWILEYIKVLLAYLFILYLWPTVVFRAQLRGKGRAYRFCFCVSVSVLLINTAVLLLGLVHLLYQPIVSVLFWGIFIIQLFRNDLLGISWLNDIRSVFNRTMTVRRMLLRWHTANRERLSAAIGEWWKSTKNRRLEYALLGLLTLFAMAYFSANALQVHSYGSGDQYVHHAWVYGLAQGKVFSAGIYPEGMHCFIYLMGTVFPLKYYSIILFLGGIHIQVYILSVYLLSRVLFRWKMSGLFALAGFLTVGQAVVNGIFGISRLSWTLPQEFALYTVFLMAYGLIGFLRHTPRALPKPARPLSLSFWRAFFSDRDLFIFVLALAVSVCVHFYATILALFVCLVIVLLNLRLVFRRGTFVRLAAGALLALLLAGVPMALARLEGYPLQGSLYWAMSVTKGDAEATEAPEMQEVEEQPTERESLQERANRVIRRTYLELYGTKRGKALLAVDLSVAGLSALVLLVFALRRLTGKQKSEEKARFSPDVFKGYLIVAVSVFVLFMAYRPKLIGLPSLIAGTRVCSTIDLFSMLLFACVLDMLFTGAGFVVSERYLKPVSALVCAGIYFFAQTNGLFHGYLYYELTRYPVAVELTKEIVENLPEKQYTIVSTTDELYQVVETGFHEEWIDFLDRSGDKSYTIPTPYLFFFIEKHPIQYAQNSFASGPSWLAAEKYTRFYRKSGAQYPEILHGEISAEAAEMDFSKVRKRSDTASSLTNRTILESRAYAWYQQFSALHPHEGRIIYEDDDFLCYCVHQNEFSLFSLGVMGE